MISFAPDASELGERIDAVVARRASVPRTHARAAIERGEVTAGGARVKPSHRLAAGELVEGDVAVPEESLPEAERIPLDIRYEDDHVLVVSKPAGLVAHPVRSHQTGTLVNALLGLGKPLGMLDPARPGIVHRLDKDTSGLLLVAKDDDTQARLRAAMKERRIARHYYALVRGTPSDSGTIEAPIGRHPARRSMMAVVPGGRPAITHYEVLQSDDRLALLEVKLETGRTHQIRVHLSHIGHPVLGDRVYGGRGELARELGLDRPFLHAFKLTFPDATGTAVEVADSLPRELLAALERGAIDGPSDSPTG
jgi:23S rRNA pseudouridine1911/1915/1917 synthase